MTKRKVEGPVTVPKIVKVAVPPTSYQFGRPYKLGVTVPPNVGEIVNPGAKSCTSTVVAPPPNAKVTGSIVPPKQTSWGDGSPLT